jgi:parallel beta-helix repeat protein
MIKRRFNKAMGLIDVLIGVVVMVIAFLGIAGAYQLSLQVSNESRLRSSAVALANKRIEQMKNMSYAQVGTIGGYPEGTIAKEEIDNSGTVSLVVKTNIIYGINCKDGVGLQSGMECPSNAYGECPDANCPIDNCPNDYKMVYVDVSWGGRFPGSVHNETIIAPSTKEQECAEKGGILLVDVFDSFGQNILSPLIKVERVSESGSWEASPESGSYAFILPEGTDDYQVSASKDGYSTQRTYAIGETYSPTGQVIAMPNKSNPSILEGQTTELSFIIDKTSDINLYTKQADIGDIYYVKKSGNDSNNGLSANLPFLTISKAISKADAGDMIFVGAGTYNESINFSSSGESDNNIVLTADTTGKYTGDSGEVVINTTSTNGIKIDNHDYITIYGFKIKNTTDSGIYLTNANNINLINNVIESNTGKAINIDQSSNISIKDSDILTNGYGVYANNSSALDIINNNFSQNSNYALQILSSNDIDVDFNSLSSNSGIAIIFVSTTNINTKNNIVSSNQEKGIKISENSQGNFENNKIYSNTAEGMYCDNSIGNVFKNNLIYSNSLGLKLTNICKSSSISSNTVYGNTNEGILIESNSISNDIRDNIVANNSIGIKVSNSTGTTESYNNVYNNSSNNYSGINQDSTSINSDPKFVNASGGDFHLSQTASGQSQNSPCLDAGSQSSAGSGLSTNYSTRSDNTIDSSNLDLGFHYYTGSSATNQDEPDPFGSNLSNVSFKFQGTKTIGTDASDKPIYKTTSVSTTDANGYKLLSGIEKDSYTFSSFSRLNLSIDLFASYPNQMPIAIDGGATTTIFMGFKSQNSLLITVKDSSTSNLIFGADVRVYNSGSDQSQITNASGQAYFLPLKAENYNIEVSAQDYATSTDSINVSGHDTQTINLSK